MTQKRTADLAPGDVVVFADIEDTVVSVGGLPNAPVLKVVCDRRIGDRPVARTFFFAGRDSVQDVLERIPSCESK
jgi:hypothetical protein